MNTENKFKRTYGSPSQLKSTLIAEFQSSNTLDPAIDDTEREAIELI